MMSVSPGVSAAAVMDPSLLTGLRDHVATTFAARIGTVLPEVNGFIEFESELLPHAGEKIALETGARQLYSRHGDIEARVAINFAATFDAIVDPVKARSLRTRNPLSSLRLLTDAQMTEELALIDCSRRLKEQAEYELFTLTRLICLLLGREHLADETNPIFPRIFADTLMRALGSVQENERVKLAMFKAFGPSLLEILPATYRSGTEWLHLHHVDVDAYVYRPVATPQRPALVQSTTTGAVADALLLGEFFTALRASTPVPGDPPAVSVATLPAGNADTTTATAMPLATTALTARVLAAMFDILEHDARIPAVMRPIIARLQQPIARLVSEDPAFLTRPAHPARQLLELIAEAGMLLDLHEKGGENVDAIDRILEHVVHPREDEPHSFRLAYERLDEWIAQQEDVALNQDSEVKALHESELRECAHDAANTVISDRLDGRVVPVEVTAFILITWRAVLVADYLHGGTDGQAWKLGVATLDELLRSIEPVSRHEDRIDRTRSLTSLLELIRDGIEHAQLHPLLSEDFLNALQALHLQALHAPGHNNDDDGKVHVQQPLHDSGESGNAAAPGPTPVQLLASLGLARGSYLDLRQDNGTQRWRLCRVTPFHGRCVLRRYGPRVTRVMPLDELRAEVATGKATPVEGMRLVGAAISAAFKRVNQAIVQPAPLRLVGGNAAPTAA